MPRILALIVAAVALAAAAFPAAAGAADTTRKARFGKSITLHGFNRERMLVRPYRLERLEPGEFEDEALTVVWVSLRNTGRTTYSDSPSNGAHLVTTTGRTIDTTIVVDDRCDGGSNIKVPRGQKRLTCLAFEVPEGVRLRYFEFALNSGFADELGQWRRLPTP